MSDGDQGLNFDMAREITSQATVSTNIRQEYFVTTREKIELALRRQLPGYTSMEQAIAATGVFLAFLVALLTSDFQSFIGVPAASWKTGFAIGAVVSLIWTVREWWKFAHRPSLDDVVNAICVASDREANEPPTSPPRS
ncbi:hypothetical protein [Nocardioides bruguierae]|uniref:Uncharacterized protein n=1 Tax=Nocardioides bruguierae TaxID=2945102 RepID=A0A9X2IFZ4_9ACTN|nr:hypothetical protein [Nocardioides bruguierae]MCM0622341.1 hypothetical protein [Nocardioides bruguierae]